MLRTVRNLLAGDGPVYNAGERVEANTSTLWTGLLALPGLVPGVSLNWAAVVLGLVLSVLGLGLGMDGARRLAGGRRRIVPLGALVVVALPPFWDFGTSGLETGLIVGWLGLTWWLLVRRLEALRRASDDGAGNGSAPTGRAWPAAVVLGLAPLVRPDLALFGLLAAVVLVLLERRRGLPRLVGLAAAAAAVPLAYEVFRAGYYGLLVPSTALAKEAGDPRWEQGLLYLDDLTATYRLWVPLAALLVAAVLLVVRRPDGDPRLRVATAAVAVAPVLAGLLLAVYVIRVGGDFMHGRMLLPALFSLVLPVLVVPLIWRTVLPVAVVGAWAFVCVLGLRPAYEDLGPGGIANERLYYVRLVDALYPVAAEDFRTHPMVPEGVAALEATAQPSLALAAPRPDGELEWRLLPAPPGAPDSIAWLNLGVAGELAPLDVRVHDGVGLVNPLAAHATGLPDGRIGHDKDLPPAWYVADAGVVDDGGFAPPDQLAAARAALACPATAEVLDSVRAPLTAERFWQNLTGAWERTSYRYDRDPTVAATCAPAE
ncbi:arabinofuranosyltransferase [Pseudonocardia humida]|uniref:arabinofuranosyltransferase n=1 Tax=Pseudonocardia humida TaxID=2800819 RepID=UPI00207C8F63|nr:arabinofuranosyltransferase [Pseudonocardia humida]